MTWRLAGPAVVSLVLFASVASVHGCHRSIREDNAPEVFGTEICQAIFNCDCTAYPYPTEEQCALDVEAEFLALQLEAEQLGLTYEGRCAGQWLDLYRTVGCVEGSTDAFIYEFCDVLGCPIYHGDVAAGNPCVAGDSFLSDCEEGLGCFNGTCVEVRCHEREGDACFDQSGAFLALCDPPFVCNPVTQLCFRAPNVGEPCPDGACENDAACNFDDPMNPVCVALPGIGGDCSMTFQCAEGDCDNDVCVAVEPFFCE